MQGYPGTGFWHWYGMPLPFRKFYANKYLKRLEKESAGSAENPKPLSMAEKMKVVKDSQQASNDPSKFANVLQSMRNSKK